MHAPRNESARWSVDDRPPATRPAEGFESPGLRAVFLEGAPWRGRPTRIFAWIGLPDGASPRAPAPAMVLVHGGGGSAFAHWVELWTKRGYAAIAMDTCGSTPDHGSHRRDHHVDGGPPGWGAYETVGEPPRDQWTWHAVDAVLRSHSLLRSLPEVDARRIGITGISWGGFLTSIVAGHDSRFRCAMPVYGCGMIRASPGLGLDRTAPEIAVRWDALWDPLRHAAGARMPMHWSNGTNDFAFTPPMWQATHDRVRGRRTLTFLKEWSHGHTEGQVRPEILAFADAELRGERSLARAVEIRTDRGRVQARFTEPVPLRRAELLWTTAGEGPWPSRKWESAPATVLRGGRAEAKVPTDAVAWCVNVEDARGLITSTRWQDRI